MKVVIQRVSEASVTINGDVNAQINQGLLLLVGIENSDGADDVEWLCNKIANLRIFDDADGIFMDEVSLNIVKACLDTSKRRWVSWNTDSHLLRREHIPERFEFKAGVIFITNVQFGSIKSKKLQEHLAALESRCHFIDLKMNTQHERILRIKQIVSDGLLDDYEFPTHHEDEIVHFVMSNADKLRELSIRTVLKAADLKKSFADTWQKMAHVTIMKH
jgi:hypothetical protein